MVNFINFVMFSDEFGRKMIKLIDFVKNNNNKKKKSRRRWEKENYKNERKNFEKYIKETQLNFNEKTKITIFWKFLFDLYFILW